MESEWAAHVEAIENGGSLDFFNLNFADSSPELVVNNWFRDPAYNSGLDESLDSTQNDFEVNANEYAYDELSRIYQSDSVLFVNTIATVHVPDVADGAADLGKGDLTPGDDAAIPGVAGVDILGRVTVRSEYDRNSRRTFRVEDDADTYRTEYDGLDRAIRVTDPEENRVEYAYDDNDNLIEQRETDVSQVAGVADEKFLTTYFYDILNRLRREVDNLGQATEFRYDSRNNLVAVSDSQGPLTGAVIDRRTFAEGAQTVNAINDFGNVTRYYYDGISRRVLEEIILTDSGSGDGVGIGAALAGVKSDPLDPASFGPAPDAAQGGGDGVIRTAYAYDDNSLLSATIDDQGNSTIYLYDNLNRMVAETHGATVATALDKMTLLGPRAVVTPTLATIDDPATISDAQIDAQLAGVAARIGLLTPLFPSLADDVKLPTTVVYGYDQEDNVLILKDENDSEIFKRYDALNRPIAVRIFRAGQADAHAGDPMFAPTPASDPSNVSPDLPAVAGTTAQDFEYDGLSRLTRATDDNDPAAADDDSVATYAYDSLSRVIEETQSVGALGAGTVSFGWRAADLQTTLVYPNGRTFFYTYDDLDRIDTIADAMAAEPIVHYSYIGPSRVLERAYPANGTRMTFLDDAGITDTGYDGLRRPTTLRHLRDDDSRVVGFVNTYDRMDNRLSESRLQDATNDEIYTYDSAYRLVGFERPDVAAIVPEHTTFALDGTGNWQQVDEEERTFSTFNELTDSGGAELAYDDNGNQTAGGGLLYEWDALNRLRHVTRSEDGDVVATYSYDAVNRRVRKVVANAGPLDGTTDFYYDDRRVIEERGDGDVLARQYVCGGYVDEILVMDRNLDGDGSATGAGDQRLFYHANGLFHVYALTDESGTILEGYLYDAYGRTIVYEPGANSTVDFGGDDTITIGGTSLFDNPYLYNGRRLDAETRLYYYRQRITTPVRGASSAAIPLVSSTE